MLLYGRTAELAQIERLLSQAHWGRSGVLVIRGEAGIGKTSLLDYAERAASGMRVLRATGVELVAELPYTGLCQLLRSCLDRLERLPDAHVAALRGALGLGDGQSRDQFLVGHAVLSVLADLADDRPLLCLVDDGQWFDSASMDALLFAARRLEAEGVVLLLAFRDDDNTYDTRGLRTLRLPGLGYAESVAVLTAQACDLAPLVRDQLIEVAGGNPLALKELPTMLSPQQRAGLLPTLHGAAGVRPAVSHVQQSFAERIAGLAEAVKIVLQVAAADGTGELPVALAAARRLGATELDVVPAEQAGLIEVAGGHIRFRHPLIRAAAYRSAPLGRRIGLHRALADTLRGSQHADRRAWHLAAATIGPDERVAAELERAGQRAAERGGCAAVAAAYERAAALTPDPHRWARRLAAAAEAAADAGRGERAAALAERAMAHLTDPVQLARLAQIRAAVAYAHGNSGTAHALIVDAAVAVAPRVPDMAALMLLEAVSAAWLSCDLSSVQDTAQLVRALRPALGTKGSPVVRAMLGLAEVAAGRPQTGLPALHDVLVEVRDRGHLLGLRERARLQGLDTLSGDPNLGYRLAVALERDCRSQGAIGLLPVALTLLARAQLLRGAHRDALAYASEGLRIAEDIGQRQSIGYLTAVLAYLAAVEGDEERCQELAETIRVQDSGPAAEWSGAVLALLELGLGRYATAVSRLEHLAGGSNLIAVTGLPVLVEAATRAGEPDRAREAFAQLEGSVVDTGYSWLSAVSLRCRALLADGHEPERYFRKAVQVHPRDEHPFERARTQLLYGEWLCSNGRHADARDPLRCALATFDRLVARPWSERARTQLQATGERATVAVDRTGCVNRLTPQELQVVQLAALGLSNRDVGTRLLLSPRTVGYYLHKAYPKLGVSCRAQLAAVVSRDASMEEPWPPATVARVDAA